MPAELPLTDDARFILGEISATVKTIPPQIERLDKKLDASVERLTARVDALESNQATHKGIIWTVSGVIAAGISGIITQFFHTGH